MLSFLRVEFTNFFVWLADIIIADEYLEQREKEWEDVDYKEFHLS
ncbi:MAG: hypothetical protein NXH75_16400 [Halobacteriovoraceae bacterium]|nr:hypothetical protein [Halobacteriovoraceae bacterium]